MNALYDSIDRANNLLPLISDKLNADLDKLEGSKVPLELGAGALIALAHFSLGTLHDSLFKEKDIGLQLWAAAVRSSLETTSNLSFCFSNPQKTSKRLQGFYQVYINSTYDLLRLGDSKNFRELSLTWRKESWTDSSYEDRIAQIGERYLVLYGYTSRLVHGINRDVAFREPTNSIFIRFYLYLLAELAFLKAIIMVEEPWVSRQLFNEAKLLIEQTEASWSTRGIYPEDLIKLTTFYDDDRNKRQADEMKNLRLLIREQYDKGSLLRYELQNFIKLDKNH